MNRSLLPYNRSLLTLLHTSGMQQQAEQFIDMLEKAHAKHEGAGGWRYLLSARPLLLGCRSLSRM
jgi:hypothetical protein